MLQLNIKIHYMNSEFILSKLNDAFNNRDIESLMECFDSNYLSEQPVHPDRTFKGTEQVRKNWTSNFIEMPDFSSRLIRHAINKNCLWAEWEWQGTRMDKSRLLMRGAMIMGVENDKIIWARLYVEPVESGGKGIDAAIVEVMQGKKSG